MEHGIFGRALFAWRILWIRNQESAGAAEGRLIVADSALIPIESDAEAGRVGLGNEIGQREIGGRTKSSVDAIVANAFKLHRALETFIEHSELDWREAVEWRAGVRRTFADARVFLSESEWCDGEAQQTEADRPKPFGGCYAHAFFSRGQRTLRIETRLQCFNSWPALRFEERGNRCRQRENEG